MRAHGEEPLISWWDVDAIFQLGGEREPGFSGFTCRVGLSVMPHMFQVVSPFIKLQDYESFGAALPKLSEREDDLVLSVWILR